MVTTVFNHKDPFPTESTKDISWDTIYALDVAAKCIEQAFGVTLEQMRSRDRRQFIVYAQHAFLALIYYDYNKALSDQGLPIVTLKVMGWYLGKAHSSVLHSIGETCHVVLVRFNEEAYAPGYLRAQKSFATCAIFCMGEDRVRARITELRRHIVDIEKEVSHLEKFVTNNNLNKAHE